MKVISLTCNHCGAPLEVSVRARFVTCGFCEARLAIEHTGNSYSTAVIEELQETTSRLSRDVAELKTTSAIEQLDSQWDRTRQQHMVTHKNGGQSLPTKGGAALSGIITTVFGVVWMIGASRFGAFALFGLVFIVFGIVASLSTHSKAESYERDLRKYQSKRRRLLVDSSDQREN